MSIHKREELRRELCRFLSVAADTPHFMEMFSPAVDAYWHDLLESGEFDNFCRENSLPQFRHSEAVGHGKIEWVSEYHRRYGRLPELWFCDEDGRLNATALDLYRATGTVHACWDCHPLPFTEQDKTKPKGRGGRTEERREIPDAEKKDQSQSS